MENIHRNVADQLLREDPRPLCVLPSPPSAFGTASTMLSFTSGWYHRFRSLAGNRGGYAEAGSSLGRLLHVESTEYRQLMDRSSDEVDVLAVPQMLSVPAPKSWATYSELFVGALESPQKEFYPNMYRRYRELTRAYEEKLITHEQYNAEPLVYAVKGTSKFLPRSFDSRQWSGSRGQKDRNKPWTAS